nr:hypothetical protein Iba_chr06dCG5650 [Ipomoea batatas]
MDNKGAEPGQGSKEGRQGRGDMRTTSRSHFHTSGAKRRRMCDYASMWVLPEVPARRRGRQVRLGQDTTEGGGQAQGTSAGPSARRVHTNIHHRTARIERLRAMQTERGNAKEPRSPIIEQTNDQSLGSARQVNDAGSGEGIGERLKGRGAQADLGPRRRTGGEWGRTSEVRELRRAYDHSSVKGFISIECWNDSLSATHPDQLPKPHNTLCPDRRAKACFYFVPHTSVFKDYFAAQASTSRIHHRSDTKFAFKLDSN